MPTTNEAILDAQLRHHVNLVRFSNGLVRKLIALLNKVDADIVDQLLRRDPNAVSGQWSRKRLEALLESIREINLAAYRRVERVARKELQQFAVYEAGFQQQMLATTIPVTLDIVAPAAAQLKAALLARPLQGKLLKEWVDGLNAASYARIRDAVRIGFVQGETIEQIVRRIKGTRALRFADGVQEVSRRAARTMAQTAVAETASFAREEVYKENSDLIAEVQWVATLDSSTCVECAALDGQTFPVEEGPRPPLHVNCRCSSVPVTKSWKDLGIDLPDLPAGTRASMNGQVSDKLTFSEWLSKQSADLQNDMLGKTKGELFRKGGLDIGDFVDRSGGEMTLDQLQKVEKQAFEKAGV